MLSAHVEYDPVLPEQKQFLCYYNIVTNKLSIKMP